MTFKPVNKRQWPQCTVAILLTLGIVGCTPEEQREKETLHVAIARAPITFDAQKATDATSLRVLGLISFGLTKWAEDMTPAPAAAKSFTHSNYQTFTLSLNNLKFQDGSPLTSGWVKNFYEEMMDPSTGSPVRGQLKDVVSIKAEDSQTVVFYLKKPNPFFWSALQIPLVKQTENRPVGLSAYRLDKTWENGDFQVKAQGEVVQAHHPASVRFHVVKDPMVRLLKLLKGGVDVVYNDIPPELFHYAERKGLVGKTAPSTSYTYLGFNFRDGNETSNPLLRQAISYAINTEELQKSILFGQSDNANSLLQENNIHFWGAPAISHSPAKACSLLKEYQNGKKDQKTVISGKKQSLIGKNEAKITAQSVKNGKKRYFSNKENKVYCPDIEPIELGLSITTSPFILRVSQVLKQQLQQVNINLTIQSAEWGTFYNNIKKGNFQTYILTWVGRFQPDVFYSFFHSSQHPPSGANRGGYSNPLMDRLLDEIMVEMADQRRVELSQEIQKRQYKDLIYLPLWRRAHSMLMGKNINKCRLDSDAQYTGLTYCQKSI